MQDDLKIWNNFIKTVKPLNINKNKQIVLSPSKIIIHKTIQSYILDLHKYTLQEAYDKVNEFIDKHFRIHTKYITIITGKGTFQQEGLIHKEICNWLDTKKLKHYIQKYEWINGNGALKIYLKTK